MAQKSKDPIERKPDLNEGANQSEIEARIKENDGCCRAKTKRHAH